MASGGSRLWQRLQRGPRRLDKEDGGDESVTLVPPITAIPRVPQEPVEYVGKEYKRREKASSSIQNPLRSPNRGGTRIRKPLGTFWISPPIMRSDGESHLRHGCLKKHLRRRVIHARSSAREITSPPDTSGWNLRGRNRIGVRRMIHVCSSLRMMFGQSVDRIRADIPRCSGCHPRQGPHHQFHGLSGRMVLGPPWQVMSF